MRCALFAHAHDLASEMIPNIFEDLIHDTLLKRLNRKKDERSNAGFNALKMKLECEMPQP